MTSIKNFRWAIDGSLKNLLNKRRNIEATIHRWQNLHIELVIIIDSGQAAEIEHLAQNILNHGLPVHTILLDDFQKTNSLSQFTEKRILILHCESNTEIKTTIQENTQYDPIFDEPLFIVEADHTFTDTVDDPIPTNVVQFPSKIAHTHQNQELTNVQPIAKPQNESDSTSITNHNKPIQNNPEKNEPLPTISNKIMTQNTQLQPVTKISGWNIKVKTVLLISTLIISALGAMIFWASREFTKDVEREIEANATYINSIVGQKVQVILEETRYSSGLIASTKSNFGPFANANPFQDNQDLIAILVTKATGNSLSIQNLVVNKNQMEANGIIADDLQNLVTLYGDSLRAAQTGATIALNASPGFRNPMVILSFPDQSKTGDVIVVLMNARKIGESFLGSDSSLSFMVDRTGSVIAHPDPTVVLEGKNVSDLPVFQEMMKSSIDTAIVRYQYNNIWYRGAYKKLPLAGLGVIYTIEETKAFLRVEQIQNRNLMVMGIVLSLAILIAYFFARSLVIPIRELVSATEKIEAEDYSIYVKPRSKDEVGVLASSFNKMVKGLTERERMKDAFGRFVNKEVAERALRGELKLGGEKKEAAVFFSDLRGFTAMSEKMSPEEVVEYLNRYFTLMVDCVDKTHGVVDKFIGDAVMATWGTIISKENDSANAVDGALMMRKALEEFNVYNKEHNHPIAKFGCGINTGPVVSGQIGSEKKLEFTVIGDAVNLASRIESLNKPFATDILISQDTYDQVSNLFDVVKMPAITVKGKTEPQTIYCVLGRKDDPTRPQNLDELRSRAGIDWAAHGQKDGVLEEEKEEKYEIIEK